MDTDASKPVHQGIFSEIQERLAAVDLSTAKPPKQEAGAGDHMVGVATDEIKRLFVVKGALIAEHNVFGEKMSKIEKDLSQRMSGRGSFATLRAMFSGEFADESVKITELEQLLSQKEEKLEFYEIVNKMFWLEIKRSFPELAQKSSGIRADWKLCWFDSSIEDLLREMLGKGIPEDLKSELRQVSERIGKKTRA